MTHPIDPLALFCAIASAICAFGYLLGACSHRIATQPGGMPHDEPGDPLGFRSVMAFQGLGAVLLAAAALLLKIWTLGSPAF
jgi:hypothetical protein